MQSLMLLKRDNDIEFLVRNLGIDLDKCPASFTECFKTTNDRDAKIVAGASSGFSRVLTSLLPTSLQGMTAEDVSDSVFHAKNCKIISTSLYSKVPTIAHEGLNRAIAFQIIRNHDDAQSSPLLQSLRARIEANAAMTKAGAKGGHKSGNPELVIEAVKQGNQQYNLYQKWERDMMISYISQKAIVDNDSQAYDVLKMVFTGKESLLALPAPV